MCHSTSTEPAWLIFTVLLKMLFFIGISINQLSVVTRVLLWCQQIQCFVNNHNVHSMVAGGTEININVLLNNFLASKPWKRKQNNCDQAVRIIALPSQEFSHISPTTSSSMGFCNLHTCNDNCSYHLCVEAGGEFVMGQVAM